MLEVLYRCRGYRDAMRHCGGRRGEKGGGSMWEMGDDESVGLTTVFMENNQICEFLCTTGNF